MGVRDLVFIAFIVASATAQSYKVCIPSTTNTDVCQALDKDGSQVVCAPVVSKVDCALKLVSGEADFGVFTEEELLLLGQIQPNQHSVVGSIRDRIRQDPYAFEAVAVVPSNHVGGLQGLKGGKYCHPGVDAEDIRWSPRVLRAFEEAISKASGTDSCPSKTASKTAEEIQLEVLGKFFTAGCRPGDWSKNETVNAALKSKYSNLCSLCAPNTCDAYPVDLNTVQVSGVNRHNRHIQALNCLTQNGNNTVAYVAWQHLKEYFSSGSVTNNTAYSLLCEDGTLRPLTNELLSAQTSPCAYVRQPYPAIVTTTAKSSTIKSQLSTWWPQGVAPSGNSWQTLLFNTVVGGSNARVVFTDLPTVLANYTSSRVLPNVDTSVSCPREHVWCTSSQLENDKCQWLRAASYVLGLQPKISCSLRSSVFECLRDVKESRADLVVSTSNYGFLARQVFRLSPVKLVQNSRVNQRAFSRIAALVKETSAQSEITRFENLRDKNACFPEFGGIAFVAFVRAAHERGVINARECDYARGVQEFFSGACAPGAQDTEHKLSDRTAAKGAALCSMCKPAPSNTVSIANVNDATCAYDYSNLYYGNNGTLKCLDDSRTHVAFVEIQNINEELTSLGLEANNYRALCRNNTLAARTGVDIDEGCLLAFVVDAEVLTRRNDPLYNSLSTLLDAIDAYFGYATIGTRLIDFKIFSPFNGISDLLFKDSANGLSEPTNFVQNEPARNYIDLFAHLETCTGSANALASQSLMSVFSVLIMAVIARIVN